MNVISLEPASNDRFHFFRCPRCARISKHVPSATRGLNLYLLCSACRSWYEVRRGLLFGLALGLTGVVPPFLLLGLLWPFIAGGNISGAALLGIATPFSVVLLLFAKRHLAQHLLRYEYIGRAAT